MSAPDISPCQCGSRLAPTLRDSSGSVESVAFSTLGVWVACPLCEMAGPRTWVCLDGDFPDAELAEAQAESARDWNRIAAAVSTIHHLTQGVA